RGGVGAGGGGGRGARGARFRGGGGGGRGAGGGPARPRPATSPLVTSGRPNVAVSLATIRSHASAISNPPARAYPSTAAMTGLAGGRWVMPPKPRPPAREFSPARNPLRSIPAENVPPAPVRMSTAMSRRESDSSVAPPTPPGPAPVTRVRAPGRVVGVGAVPA